jgi:hypothetical protein
MPVASLLIDGICAAASAMPIRMIVAKISRRTSRSRVAVTGESSPTPTTAVSFLPRRDSARSTISATMSAPRR